MHSLRTGILALAGIALVAGLHASASAQDMGDYVIKQLDELEFVPFAEGSPLQVSVISGDMATGPVTFLLRVPPNFDEPIHAHTSGYRAVIIKGSALHWIDGEDRDAAEPVEPGGYWYQPGGQFHGDANPTDEETVAVITFDGPPDFIPKE